MTNEGQRLVDGAADVLGAVSRLRADIGVTGKVLRSAVVGMIPTTTRLLTVPLMSGLRKYHPEARLEIVEASSAHLLEWLGDGRLDMAVLNDSATAKRFAAERIVKHQLRLVGSKRLPALPPKVQFADLGSFPLALSGRVYGLRREIDALASQRGVRLNITIDTDSLTALMQLIDAGLAWSMLPAFDGRTPEAAKFQSSIIVAPFIEKTLVIATPVNRPRTTGINDLIGLLKPIIRDAYTKLG